MVTLNIVSEVLHVPKVAYPDYPVVSVWGLCPSTSLYLLFVSVHLIGVIISSLPIWPFLKALDFLTWLWFFFLHPFSHYNSITEPRAWFLFSLLKHLTIDFPSHFILSIIDVYRDTTTHDKLIFPLAITMILRHFSIPFPISDHFYVMCAIDAATIKQSEAQLRSRWSGWTAPPTPSAPSTSAPFFSTGRVTHDAIMA